MNVAVDLKTPGKAWLFPSLLFLGCRPQGQSQENVLFSLFGERAHSQVKSVVSLELLIWLLLALPAEMDALPTNPLLGIAGIPKLVSVFTHICGGVPPLEAW